MRLKKVNLDYFSLDINLFQDEKIKILYSKYGADGFVLFIYILTKIYGVKGYYYNWNEFSADLISLDLKFDLSKVNEIIKFMIEISLFDKVKFEKYKILTSKRIQETYLFTSRICRRKDIVVIKEYLINWISEELVDEDIKILELNTYETEQNSEELRKNSEELGKNTEELGKNSEELRKNSENLALSKVNKSKVNKSKEKESKVNNNIGSQKSTSVDPTPLVKKWNEFAREHRLPTIIKLTEKRRRAVLARMREKEFDLDKIFEFIKNSKFLLGLNDRNWKVDFDFVFCSANNYLKILEGKYSNKVKKVEIKKIICEDCGKEIFENEKYTHKCVEVTEIPEDVKKQLEELKNKWKA